MVKEDIMKKLYISLVLNSEHLEGEYQGWEIHILMSRKMAQYYYANSKGKELFYFGFMGTRGYTHQSFGIVRIENEEITGFYPINVEEYLKLKSGV